MAHEIFSSRFTSRNEPAWHGIGITTFNPQPAEITLDMIGDIELKLQPLFVDMPDGTQIETDQRAIVRMPTDDDVDENGNHPARIFGLVTDKYVMVTPRQIARMMDTITQKVNGDYSEAVETMGFLGKGDRFFMSIELPSFDVKNDGSPLRNFFLVYSPFNGKDAVKTAITSVRPVCWNTVQHGLAVARETIVVHHTEGVHKRLADSIFEVYSRRLSALDLIKEAADVLAQTRVSAEQVRNVADATYKMPSRPDPLGEYQTSYKKRLHQFERAQEKRAQMIDTVVNFFNGGGTGLDGKIAGTAWAGYQAICEVETFRRDRGQDGLVTSLIDGDRNQNMLRAYNGFYQLAVAEN